MTVTNSREIVVSAVSGPSRPFTLGDLEEFVQAAYAAGFFDVNQILVDGATLYGKISISRKEGL